MPQPDDIDVAIVALTGVGLRYAGFTALRDVNIRIRPGEFFTLLGPSGCGKTSILRIIGGFQDSTEGQVHIAGAAMTRVPPHRRPVNTVFQGLALFPYLTVVGNVAFGLRMLEWPEADVRDRVNEMLALVNLSDRAAHLPSALSGGQQQRVALARALAPRPRVLLLDEPMSALDLKLRKEMQGELRRLHREAGITFVMVTHDQEEALSLSDRIAVLRDGEVQQVAAPDALYRRPANAFVADFIGEANLIPASELGLTPASARVMLRPEDVRLAAGAGRIGGQAVDARYLGRVVELTVRTKAGSSVRLYVAREDTPPEGAEVRLDWADTAPLC